MGRDAGRGGGGGGAKMDTTCCYIKLDFPGCSRLDIGAKNASFIIQVKGQEAG